MFVAFSSLSGLVWSEFSEQIHRFQIYPTYIASGRFLRPRSNAVLYEPNRMQMRKTLCSPSLGPLAFDSALVKYGVWPGLSSHPNKMVEWHSSVTTIHVLTTKKIWADNEASNKQHQPIRSMAPRLSGQNCNFVSFFCFSIPKTLGYKELRQHQI